MASSVNSHGGQWYPQGSTSPVPGVSSSQPAFPPQGVPNANGVAYAGSGGGSVVAPMWGGTGIPGQASQEAMTQSLPGWSSASVPVLSHPGAVTMGHPGMYQAPVSSCMESCLCSGLCGTCCGPDNGEPLDPYCCSHNPGQPGAFECLYSCCDCTFLVMIVLFFLSIIGLAITAGTSSTDNIFASFKAKNTVELEEKLHPYYIWNVKDDSSETVEEKLLTTALPETAPPADVRKGTTVLPSFTFRRLPGSFGDIRMEDNLNANVFVTQLSLWNNSRTSLYVLAVIYTSFAIIYALLIHQQRKAYLGDCMPTLTPEEQAEFLKMTTQQQQAALQQLKQASMHGNEGCCGGSRGVEVYDTPFYEFLRIAWFISGITTFAWCCNMLLSFWAFSSFYEENTVDVLRTFWLNYSRKFTTSLIVITIYLSWPLFNIFVELVVMIVGFLPWLIIRNVCKPGIALLRPSLSISQLPGYVRCDMFFMDFADLKRFGFSRQAWIILTGGEAPFCDCCNDPSIDRDPDMTQLMQRRLQWQQQMMSMMAPWLRMQQPAQQQQMMMSGAMPPPMGGTVSSHVESQKHVEINSRSSQGGGGGDDENGTTRRRHHRSGTRSREHRHRGHTDPGQEAQQSAQFDGESPTQVDKPRLHRHHSRTKSGGESPSKGGGSPRHHRRHRRSHSPSRDTHGEVAVNMDGSTTGTPGFGDSVSRSVRSGSRRRSGGGHSHNAPEHHDKRNAGLGANDLDALMEL